MLQKHLSITIAAALLVIAMPTTVSGGSVLTNEDSDPAWAQNAQVVGRIAGAACYGRSWGKLQYANQKGTKNDWLQQLLPDCLATPYQNPFNFTDTITINGKTQNYQGLLNSITSAPYVTQRYKGSVTVGEQSMAGHSSYGTKSRNKGSSEIDFRLKGSKVACKTTKEIQAAKNRSLNLNAWDDFAGGNKSWRNAMLNNQDKCLSFQYPITVVRPGKVVACLDNTGSVDNFTGIGKYFGIVVESQSWYQPLGQMFAGRDVNSIYHYDVYIHMNDIVPTPGRPITINGVSVPTTGWCNYLKERQVGDSPKGYVSYGEVVGLMAASGTVVTHLHLETLVCNKKVRNEYVANEWTGDSPSASGCRWNRPYWSGTGGGVNDRQELPGDMKDGSNLSGDWWNGKSKWFKLLPPFTELN